MGTPSVSTIDAAVVRDAVGLFGLSAVDVGRMRKALREHFLAPGVVAEVLRRSPEGADQAFRTLAVDGATSVEALIDRGWAGTGTLPAPLDWLQRRGLVAVGSEGLVHAVAEARRGFNNLTFDLASGEPTTGTQRSATPLVLQSAKTVLIAPSAAALNAATAVTAAQLRTVTPTVAISDKTPTVVQAALESAGQTLTAPVDVPTTSSQQTLPGSEEQAVGPRNIRLLVTKALEEGRQLRIEYSASSRGGQTTERVVDPWSFNDDLLIGYCHLRDAQRHFALDRIGRARLLTSTVVNVSTL